MKKITCYIGQTLPDLHEGDDYGPTYHRSPPSWVFLSILAVSILIPIILWKTSEKNEKKFGSSEKSVGEFGLWKISKCMK